jgi:ATP-dependent DNA helicase RecG
MPHAIFLTMKAAPMINAKLSSLGVNDHADALLCLPSSYVDKTRAVVRLNEVAFEVPSIFAATVLSAKNLDADGNEATRFPVQVAVDVEFSCGSRVTIKSFGAGKFWGRLRKFDHISFQATKTAGYTGGIFLKGVTPDSITGHVEPVYVGISGQVSGALVGAAVSDALQQGDATLQSACGLVKSVASVSAFLHSQKITPRELLLGLHSPTTVAQGNRCIDIARRASVAEVRSMGRVALAHDRANFNIDAALIPLVAAQPEKLSQGQRVALNDIRKFLNKQCPAQILLNGDVGSGKTIVFLLAAAAVLRSTSGKGAVVVPSELVASQIYEQALRRFPDLCPALVTGSSSPAADTARLLVGTQAIFNLQRSEDLAILVIDEQHKLSVEQRERLTGRKTHVIEASATPMPRSKVLAHFSGWSEARIEGSHVAKSIASHLLASEDDRIAYRILQAQLALKKKVVVVYPRVGDKENKSAKSVLNAAITLEERFPNQVVALHGKLKSEAKAQALQEFASGLKPIAVATTVIEVGVDVPDIGCMVVRDAECFGLAQLHQLRGRLARNGGSADFIMIPSGKMSKTTAERLETVRMTQSGFDLAELDVQLRGFGNLLGDSQTGASDTLFKLTSLTVADFVN